MTRRIRVLYTISNFDTAGSGKVVYDLVNRLDKTKFDAEIACGSDSGAFFKSVKALGVPIHIIETKTRLKPYLLLIFRILKISKFFRSQNYDVIHSWQWSSDWTEAIAAKLAGVKWLYTKKAMGFQSRHWRVKSYLADFIVTVNSDMHSLFPNKKKQILIPFGLDTAYYNPDLFIRSNTSGVFNIIAVANLVAVKNIEIIIKAIYELKDASIQLKIVGDTRGSYADFLKQQVADFHLTKQVFFLGKQNDVRPLLFQSDLYIISSKQEGMPMALVEAMSMAIPVIGSDVSGIRYVLKDFENLLFCAEDYKMLKQKISDIKCMSKHAREILGQNLRSYSVQNFSINNFIKTHEVLYRDLLKKEK